MAAAAAEAAALCLQFQPMSDYLENTLGVDNVIMRSRLIRSGFKLPDTVATKKITWVKSVCYTIRKQSGTAVTKEISMELEENLDWFVKWCIYMYLTQRNLDLDEATLDHIREIGTWYDQLQDDPDESIVDKFTDGCSKREWIESIRGYFNVKKGVAGLPLAYVIRDLDGLPADDPGFGNPDFDTELAARGRHEGHYWRADNKSVWLFLQSKCHGTSAWNCILRFERQSNGRGAFKALCDQYVGADGDGPFDE